jgi:biopolymer transport protein ExbD
VLAADGSTQIDSKPAPSDDAILAQSRAAREKNPELRAIIKADSSVPHGRVIHVLDLLKQAQVAKIAFGVSPVAPGVPGVPTGGGGGAPAPAPAPVPPPAPGPR